MKQTLFKSKSLGQVETSLTTLSFPARQCPYVIPLFDPKEYLDTDIDKSVPPPTSCVIPIASSDPSEAPSPVQDVAPDSPASKGGFRKNLKSMFGIFLGLFSGLCNSFISLLVKFNDTRSIFEVSTYRFAVMIVPPILLLIYHKKNPFAWKLVRSVGWVLVLRGVLGCGATFTRYYALQKLPLADASVIMFSSPVFVAIFSRIFLKEPFRWSHALAIVVTLTGCILVSRPPAIFGTLVAETSVDWNGRIWGYVASIASAMFTASVYVTIRHMKNLDSNFVLFYMAVVGLIVSAIVTGALNQFGPMNDPKEIGAFFGVGFLAWLSSESMVRALRLETASLIALLRTGDIVWAFIWQITIFKMMPHYFSIIGAVLVVLCVSLLSIKESISKLPADSRARLFVEKMMRPANKLKEISCKGTARSKGESPPVAPATAVPQ